MTALLADQLSVIASAPNGVKKLRELILQLAVMGKLVPQDPNDEPASELLRKIKAAKVKEESLDSGGKKTRPRSMNDDAPRGWAITTIGSIIDLISGQHLKPEEYQLSSSSETIPYLTGPAEFGERYPTPNRYTCHRRAVAKQGDLLLTVKGAGVGKTNLTAQFELAISRQLMAIRPILTDVQFIEIVMRSIAAEFQAQAVGIAIPGISRDDVQNKSICLPPLAEQHRIVAKVDELMALCVVDPMV